jgi:hypothetical protein
LAWLVGLVSIIVIAYRREQTHGQINNIVENDAGETTRKQQELKTVYREHIEAANEEPISALPEINDQQEVYWRDAFDIYSIHQLAELARRGPTSTDAKAVTDGGSTVSAIAQIEAENIHDSWLAEAFSTNRLSSPQETLSGMRAALRRIESKYGMGHIYNETRGDVEELLEAVQDTEGGF